MDVVSRQGERVIVRSAHPMPSWQPRRHRRIAVMFRDVRYCVVAARTTADGFEYDLEPWPDVLHELPGQVIVYDERYVAERDEEWRAGRALARQYVLMLPVRPFLGFLPSWLKARLHERYGVEPRAATQLSLYIECALMLLAGVCFAVGGWASSAAPVLWDLGKAFPVLLIDAIVRGGALLGERERLWGFYEWLVAPVARAIRGRR